MDSWGVCEPVLKPRAHGKTHIWQMACRAETRTGLGKSDRPGSQGGLWKRGLWRWLNGHVERKRRNSQAIT